MSDAFVPTKGMAMIKTCALALEHTQALAAHVSSSETVDFYSG